MFASVVINVLSSNVDQTYEYLVNDIQAPYISIGARVNVTFGTGNRLVMGYVLDLYEEKKFSEEPKVIYELLDYKPVLTPLQIKLAKFIKDDCICPLIRVLNLMVPNALILRTNKYLVVKDSSLLDARLLPFVNKGIIDIRNTPHPSIIKNEINKGNLEVNYEMKSVANFKYVTTYSLNKSVYHDMLYTIKSDQKRLFLKNYDDKLTKNDILYNYDISLYALNDLIKKKFLTPYRVRVSRNISKDEIISINESDIELSSITEEFKNISTPHLYIPSSFKEAFDLVTTLVFNNLKENKTSVILCSDIFKSVKYANMLRKTLGISVACLNSSLSSGELLDYYTDILDEEYKVIVTTPIGALYPYKNVGLYYMLDEDSENYFNDQSPRYDLRKIFYYLSYTTTSLFIMESFSPSVNSYCYGLKSLYHIVDKKASSKVTNCEVVSMINELSKGNNSPLSARLKDCLIRNKKASNVSLLIVNNKNYSNYVMCRSCGEVSKCSYCDLSLKYNEKKNMLICPSCGRMTSFNNKCPKCLSDSLSFGGVGIELVKEELDKIGNSDFHFNTIIIDDNTKKDFDLDYCNKVSLIEDKEVDVVITTEYYAKSLSNLGITLAAVVDFDSSLNSPTFDSGSRCYNLLVNARTLLASNGLLLVQTTNVTSNILSLFTTGSYIDFIKEELKIRKLTHNEPFYKVNRLIIKGKYEEMFKTASDVKKTLKTIDPSLFVLGPSYSNTLKGVVLIIKHNSKDINNVYKKIYEHYQSSTVNILFDKYPRRL